MERKTELILEGVGRLLKTAKTLYFDEPKPTPPSEKAEVFWCVQELVFNFL